MAATMADAPKKPGKPKPPPEKTWGDRLAELRKSKGLNQPRAAAILEVPLSTLRNWEQDRVSPPAYVAKLVMKALAAYEPAK